MMTYLSKDMKHNGKGQITVKHEFPPLHTITYYMFVPIGMHGIFIHEVDLRIDDLPF